MFLKMDTRWRRSSVYLEEIITRLPNIFGHKVELQCFKNWKLGYADVKMEDWLLGGTVRGYFRCYFDTR